MKNRNIFSVLVFTASTFMLFFMTLVVEFKDSKIKMLEQQVKDLKQEQVKTKENCFQELFPLDGEAEI